MDALVLPRLWLPPKEKGLSFHLPKWRDIVAMSPLGQMGPNHAGSTAPLITIVQATGLTYGFSTTDVTFGAQPAAGHTLVFAAVTPGGSVVPTSGTDTWVTEASYSGALTQSQISICLSSEGGSADQTIVGTISGEDWIGWAWELAGVASFDKASGSTSGLTPGSLTPAMSGEIFFAVGACYGSSPMSAPSGWTDAGHGEFPASGGGGYRPSIAAYLNPGVGAQNPTFGAGGSNPDSSAMICLKP